MALTQNIQVNVASGGVPPYTYQFFSDNDCVTFSNPVGISQSPTILNTLTFTDEACRDNAVMSVTIIDGVGCTSSIAIPGVDQCAGLVVNGITRSEDYTFNVTASSDTCSSLNFQWSYNQNVFEEINTNNSNYASSLQLRVRDNLSTIPINATVSVTVTDCNNCESLEQLTFPLCVPKISNVSIPMECVEQIQGQLARPQSVVVTFPAPTNCTTPIDWETINFTLPTGITAVATSNPREWRFVAATNVVPGTYGGSWSVVNEANIPSNSASITFVVPECNTNDIIKIISENITLDCANIIPGETIIDIVIEDNVVSTSPIDWSTFMFLNSGDWASPSVTKDTAETTGDHVIKYQIPDPIVDDTIRWTVCNETGQCAEAAVYTVLSCFDPPQQLDATICSICGDAVSYNVLDDYVSSNPIDLNAIIVTIPPTQGGLTRSGNIFTYTPNQNGPITDQFSYTVTDVFGNPSDEAVVTIENICAGQEGTINLCN